MVNLSREKTAGIALAQPRYGVMREYIGAMRRTSIKGIPAEDWSRFFGEHSEFA